MAGDIPLKLTCRALSLRVAEFVDGPAFGMGNGARVGDDGAGVGSPARDAVLLQFLRGIGEPGAGVGEDRLGVRGMDSSVVCAVKDDGADAPLARLLPGAGFEAPRIAANGRSAATPCGSPEWTPAAA